MYLLDRKKSKFKRNSYKLDIAKDFTRLKSILTLKDVVIHLAWDTREDFPNNKIITENKKMAENIYRAAIRAGVKRIIFASSVHTSDYSNKKNGKIYPSDNSWPDTPYGASKLYIENLKQRQRSCGSLVSVTAAVLRNLGIQTKLIDGRSIKRDPRMRHAWVEVFIDGSWVPFDIIQKDYALTPHHVKLGEYLDWEELEK